MTGELSKNFHGVGIGPLSKIQAVNALDRITVPQSVTQSHPQLFSTIDTSCQLTTTALTFPTRYKLYFTWISRYNVRCNKNRTKLISVLLLWLVRFLIHQTFYVRNSDRDFRKIEVEFRGHLTRILMTSCLLTIIIISCTNNTIISIKSDSLSSENISQF